MGQLRVFGTGTKFWGGQGELSDQKSAGQNLIPVELTENGRNEQTANFVITYSANGGSEGEVGQLLIYLPPLPQDKISAVLTQAGMSNRVILERLGTYEGEYEGGDEEEEE